MKKLLAGLFLACGLLSAEGTQYRFSKGEKQEYTLELVGCSTYAFETQREEKSDIFVQTRLLFIPEQTDGETTLVKVEPRRTLIRIGKNLLEDTTFSETMTSPTFGIYLMAINRQGNITKVEPISSGTINILRLLEIMPHFPAPELKPGTTWKQTLPALNFPGLTLGELEFTYTLTSLSQKKAAGMIVGNQLLRKKKQEKGITASLQGRNIAKGFFIFDCQAGQLEEFSGDFTVFLQNLFVLPGSPERSVAQKTSLPIRVNVNFTLSLKRQIP
ncbi:MAG: hypothetical protein NC911_05770 [Candidatus Omnitrophica bacterium]|nr:hypothetical protein [Candidatus Omnitrophota bacterium]